MLTGPGFITTVYIYVTSYVDLQEASLVPILRGVVAVRCIWLCRANISNWGHRTYMSAFSKKCARVWSISTVTLIVRLTSCPEPALVDNIALVSITVATSKLSTSCLSFSQQSNNNKHY